MLCFVALRCCGGPRDPTQHVHLSFYLLSHLFPSPPLLPLLLLTAFSAMEHRQPSTGPHKKSSGKGKARKEAAAGAVYEDGDEEDGDATPPGGPRTDEEKKRRSMPPSSSAAAGGSKRGSGSGGAAGPCCQAEKCAADLTEAKRYYRRHKVCEAHSKAAAVVVAGLRQRFCQQCSRFHELSEFDDSKRSCRRRLAGHNERRRKSSSDGNPDGRIQMSDSTHSHSLQR